MGTPRHERIPAAARHRSRGRQGSCCRRTRLADDPRPEAAHALGASGYYRLHVDTWRILYRPDGDTITVHVLKVGRST
ncbi:type II toxin-antitoxin system RelE/ParE family toxin [Streptomyces sp. NPDC008240]|uniref:type II toxin-antitoxin system RelE family toxin n=1 Tax=Streptomyces sp. NPDC008240 TaxID=3364822 RepID=UPI0036E32921